MKIQNPLKKIVVLLCTVFCLTSKVTAQYTINSYGITLCGAEFGEKNLPGVLNVHYTYPTVKDIHYFASKGIKLIQLPFKWERIQQNLGGPLNQRELLLIQQFVDNCAYYDVKVNLVLQNFGRYSINNIEYIVGGNVVSANHLADFWQKMAKAMINKQNIVAFTLMNEPHDMQGYNWPYTVQKVINSIRQADGITALIIDGENYSNPATWEYYNDNLKYLKDPANNIYFNAHCYFDNDYSGRYKVSYDYDGANEWTGVQRIQPFINWLKKNNLKGYVGEFGIPKNDARWFKVLNNFLECLKRNNLKGSYWAAGPWWKNYPLSIQPENNQDQPQLLVYQKYFTRDHIR